VQHAVCEGSKLFFGVTSLLYVIHPDIKYLWEASETEQESANGFQPETQEKIRIPAKIVVKFRVANRQRTLFLG
jgi:hypothetical protein